jgi:enoyl-CoA hydratase
VSEALLQEDHGGTRVLRLNRPSRRNALDSELLRALERELAAAEADPEVGTIVLTGADPSFCAGVDLRELEQGAAPEMGAPLAGVSKPVIAAVNGPAVTGGLELALMCDLIVASERARFGDTHGRVGLLPGWGQIARLPAAIGTRRAAELLLTSRLIDAEEASRIGLVNELVAHEQLLPRCLELSAAMLESDGPTIRAILDQLRHRPADLAEALALERERADAWQGGGFDSSLVSRRREELK